jgi:hypothetical protein
MKTSSRILTISLVEMTLNGDDINTNANVGSSTGPYMLLPSIYEIILHTLFVAICLDLLMHNIRLLAINLDLLFIYSPLICMTSLILIFLIILYLLLRV